MIVIDNDEVMVGQNNLKQRSYAMALINLLVKDSIILHIAKLIELANVWMTLKNLFEFHGNARRLLLKSKSHLLQKLAPISSCAPKKPTISSSSIESKYQIMCYATKKVVWLRKLLNKLSRHKKDTRWQDLQHYFVTIKIASKLLTIQYFTREPNTLRYIIIMGKKRCFPKIYIYIYIYIYISCKYK